MERRRHVRTTYLIFDRFLKEKMQRDILRKADAEAIADLLNNADASPDYESRRYLVIAEHAVVLGG